MTSLAELYLPEVTRSSMNFPNCTGNEMLSVVRVAMCSSTYDRVTQYMHNLNMPTAFNLVAAGLRPAQCVTRGLWKAAASDVGDPPLGRVTPYRAGQLAARRSRSAGSRRLRPFGLWSFL
jgi:hypothetical protein